MRVGDRITLHTPDNPRLDGTEATVTALTDWGAHVAAPSAATGAFRAAWSEMLVAAAPAPQDGKSPPTGDVCRECGSLDMVRSGACLTCRNCGTSGGCG